MKLTSTWAEHCPAYYMALDLDRKELMIAVRGTAQIEDVVTDLTALPKVGQLARADDPQTLMSCLCQILYHLVC